MGNNQNKSSAPVEFGEDLRESSREIISKTEEILRKKRNSDMKPGHVAIARSIDKEIAVLRKVSEKGGEVKVGILGRSTNQERLVDALFLSQARHNCEFNTFISSKQIKTSHILTKNNLDEETKLILDKQINHNLKPYAHKNANLIFTKHYPTPSIINDNLIVTCSSKLKPVISNIIEDNQNHMDIEIDIDNVIKFLLFSALHDLLIYIPDDRNLNNEISYLDFISNNMLILKLIKRNNFFIILDKKRGGVSNHKMQNLITKLGKTVIHELDYSNAEKDKIKFLGCMIKKHGSKFVRNSAYDEIEFINSKFDRILKGEEYQMYLQEKKDEEREEKLKKIKNPEYKMKKVERVSFEEFKRIYVSGVSDLFHSFSNIDSVEESLFQAFLNIISSKINLIRSNINFKLLLFENYNEIEDNSDFLNTLIITRNEMVEDMQKSFNDIKEILKTEETHLIDSCETLMTSVLEKKTLALDKERDGLKSTIFDIFDASGDFVPYNGLIHQARKEFSAFNKNTFVVLSRISNLSFKILDLLSKSISNKYTSLFLNLEKKHYTSNIINHSIDEIIKSKLDNINTLAIHLLSIFGNTNFNLEKKYPWYIIPSFAGSSALIFSLLNALVSKNSTTMVTYPIIGGALFTIGLIFSNILKRNYINQSRQNFLHNIEHLIGFISLKKDKIVHFPFVFDKFCEIYSRETLELLDLVTGINN